jgi:hypothetical protein
MSQLLFAESFNIGASAITTAMIQASNGDYVLTGRVYDEMDQAVAIRVDQNGLIVWENTYNSDYSVFFKSITQLADGTFIAVGSYFYSNISGDEYIWVVRLDAMGRKIWEKTFGNKEEQNDGYDVIATSDGGFIVAGLVLDKKTYQPQTWVLKFDKNCNLQWDKLFANGVAFSVIQTRDGGYAFSGAHNLPGSLNSDVYVLRLDAKGNTLWEKVYQDYEVYVLLESGVVEDSKGNLVVAAKQVLMQLDASGNVIWARQSASFRLNSVVQLPDGTYGIGGGLVVNDYDHAYVAVIDQQGENITWDNTEILYSSGLSQILVNRDGFVAGGGYGPVNLTDSIMFLAIFDPARTVALKK